MGACGSTHTKAKTSQPLDTTKMELQSKKMYFTAELMKNRRMGQYNQTEKQLLSMINDDITKRNQDSEHLKASTLLQHQLFVNACNYIMVYCNILKDNKNEIQLSEGKLSKIEELKPYIAGIAWGCVKLDLDEETQNGLKDSLIQLFGRDMQGLFATSEQHIRKDLALCFEHPMPTDEQIQIFLIEFCKKHNIALEAMQQAGHKLVPPQAQQQQQFIINIEPQPYQPGANAQDMNIKINYGN